MHNRTATDQYNLQCIQCKTLFNNAQDLNKHLKLKQCPELAGKKIQKTEIALKDASCFVCVLCGNQYKSYQKLKYHEFSHGAAKKYACTTCGKSFRFQNNLYQHKFTHLSEKKYNCTMCSKVFKRLSGMNQVHIWSTKYILGLS